MAPKPSRESSVELLTVQEAVTETIHRTFDRQGQHLPPKAIAQNMNLSLSVLYDIADEHRERKLRAEEIPSLVRASSNFLVLDVVERSLGRVAFVVPRVGLGRDDFYTASINLVERVTAVTKRLHDSLEDNHINTIERADLRQLSRELHSATAELEALIEAHADAGAKRTA
jgi:hypothetical protein